MRSVAAGAVRAYPKRLRTNQEGGTLPQLVYCRDQAQQATEVCERVCQVGLAPSHCARYEQVTLRRRHARFVQHAYERL